MARRKVLALLQDLLPVGDETGRGVDAAPRAHTAAHSQCCDDCLPGCRWRQRSGASTRRRTVTRGARCRGLRAGQLGFSSSSEYAFVELASGASMVRWAVRLTARCACLPGCERLPAGRSREGVELVRRGVSPVALEGLMNAVEDPGIRTSRADIPRSTESSSVGEVGRADACSVSTRSAEQPRLGVQFGRLTLVVDPDLARSLADSSSAFALVDQGAGRGYDPDSTAALEQGAQFVLKRLDTV